LTACTVRTVQESPELPSGAGGMLGIGSDEVLQRLLSNPAAVAALSKPKVQEALRESAGSKWKMLKYMFDPDVRQAVKVSVVRLILGAFAHSGALLCYA
jgi:hypothetical protein